MEEVASVLVVGGELAVLADLGGAHRVAQEHGAVLADLGEDELGGDIAVHGDADVLSASVLIFQGLGRGGEGERIGVGDDGVEQDASFQAFEQVLGLSANAAAAGGVRGAELGATTSRHREASSVDPIDAARVARRGIG